MTPAARHIGMMPRRQVRRGLVATAVCGLLGVVLAGCGSVTASTGAPAPGTSTPAGGAASTPAVAGSADAVAPASASAAAPQVGCASVNQATAVTISRLTHLVPRIPDGLLMATDRNPVLVRALFRDFCNAVTHPDVPSAMMGCPADFGIEYLGAFYAGHRVLASYTYAASGCRRVSITVGSTTQSTILAGRAAAAAPHLAADFGAVLGSAQPDVGPLPPRLNPGGPNKPA